MKLQEHGSGYAQAVRRREFPDNLPHLVFDFGRDGRSVLRDDPHRVQQLAATTLSRLGGPADQTVHYYLGRAGESVTLEFWSERDGGGSAVAQMATVFARAARDEPC